MPSFPSASSRPGVVHSKYLIVDERNPVVGTANWGLGCSSAATNIGLIIRHCALAAQGRADLRQAVLGIAPTALPVDPGTVPRPRGSSSRRRSTRQSAGASIGASTGASAGQVPKEVPKEVPGASNRSLASRCWRKQTGGGAADVAGLTHSCTRLGSMVRSVGPTLKESYYASD